MSDGIRIKDLPKNERPRERLAELGGEGAAGRGVDRHPVAHRHQGRSALQIAEELLKKFGKLSALAGASLEELQIDGIGQDKAIALQSAFTLAARMAQELQREAPLLDTPELVADYLRDENRGYNVEHFQAVLLNARRKLIKVHQISQGLVDSILVHPREVFRAAIAANACFPRPGA